jgi:hypothetical protein
MTPSYLLVRGPYRFTRNPMYVAAIAIWFGFGPRSMGAPQCLWDSRPPGPLWNSPWCRSRSTVWKSDGERPTASTGGKCRAGSAAGLFDIAVAHKPDCCGFKSGRTDGEQNLCRDARNFSFECVASSGHSSPPRPRKGLGSSNPPRSASQSRGFLILREKVENLRIHASRHGHCSRNSKRIYRSSRRQRYRKARSVRPSATRCATGSP